MDKKSMNKKNPCPDCNFCQACSESRCSMCRPRDGKSGKKKHVKKPHVPLFRMY